MDDKWEHTPSDTIRVSIQSKERVNNFGDLPYEIQNELRELSCPWDAGSVPANAFDNIYRWERSDGVTTFIADEHGSKEIFFCDFLNGAAIGHAAIQSASLIKIFVRLERRHHYEAAHLLIAINDFLQEKDKHLDSGTLTATSNQEGWRQPESYSLAHAVWKKLVDAGLAEPVAKKNGNGLPDQFRFVGSKKAVS